MLSDDEWEKFFGLLERIVNHSEPWKDKKAVVQKQARLYDNLENLDEFTVWFCDDATPETS